MRKSGVSRCGLGTNRTMTRWRCSMPRMALRFSLRRKVATSTGSSARIRSVFSFIASSSRIRRMDRARDSTPRMVPWPLQRGQTSWLDSPREGRRRWRDISIRPKREMRPSWTRARSCFMASRSRFSTSRWLRAGVMSMKSMTKRPPRSRSRSWREISSAASRLVLRAVSSMSAPLVARAELMSMEVRASVWSITIEPPEGSRTSRWKADSIWLSIW